jgi:hypothetical protein
MSADDLQDPSPDMEMSTMEAAAYLSGPVGFPLSTKLMYLLRSLRKGPVAEKHGARLVYRKSALDAFLRENGTDIRTWSDGIWRDVAGQLRAISEEHPDLHFGALVETLESKDQSDWDPDQAN